MNVWWYVARAAGMVAWVMLTGSVVVGVAVAGRRPAVGRRPPWWLDLHRGLGGLTIAMLGLHVIALVADHTVDFGLAAVTIPMASTWRPGAVALGVVSAWLLVAVSVTSMMMRRLPRQAWWLIHLTSYASFLLVSLHAAAAGSDAGRGWYRVIAVLSVAAVAVAVVVRLVRGRPAPRPRRLPARPAGAPPRVPVPVPNPYPRRES